MHEILLYTILFCIIVLIGQIFDKYPIPISLLLVLTGMILSFIPWVPEIHINPNLVLNVVLPVLLYQISSFSSWIDIRQNLRPILLLSVGHVVFITIILAVLVHALIPQMGWPLAFVLAAVISPPDDVAIVTIAEKIHIPRRIITILEGEGLLNDATALTLFRFALAAALTQTFSLIDGLTHYFLIVVGEIIYGLVIGNIIGELRLHIKNSMIHIIASLVTPFLAYIPVEIVGGSGILSTVVVGFVIGHRYSIRFTPEYRVISRGTWNGIFFLLQNILFLVLGLNFQSILNNISSLSIEAVLGYSLAIVIAVIVGRFLWVFGAVYFLPRLISSIRRNDPYPPWQYPFFISWAGMRGGISLAAALAVPMLPFDIYGVNIRDLIIFLTFMVICSTFILQGLSIPWLINFIGLKAFARHEIFSDHISELEARLKMNKSALKWLKNFKEENKDNPDLYDDIRRVINDYKFDRSKLKVKIGAHMLDNEHDDILETEEEIFLYQQIIEVERSELLSMWRKGKISLDVRNRLLSKLDSRSNL